MKNHLLILLCSTALLTACSKAGDVNDAAEDKLEHDARASAASAGSAVAALGLSEAQLLEADLLGPDHKELGDVAGVVRDANGKVDRLLVEIEGSDPDRYVHVPIADLATVQQGNDIDLATMMTKQQLAALPEVPLPRP